MPRPILRLAVLAAALTVWSGCDSLSRSGDTTFTGTVTDASTLAPIEGVLVRANGGGGQTGTSTTGADGVYSITLEADSTDQVFSLTVTRTGYASETETALADVDDVVVVDFPLARDGGDDGLPPQGESGPATSLTLETRTSETVGVTGAGARETATLVFQAFDGQGRAVNTDNAVDVSFEIVAGPGGGESIDPVETTTDAQGRTNVTLTSGDRAGTVQILATATAEDGTEIRSLPVTITITGGLPDEDHFSVGPAQFNFAGYNVLGLENEVTAYVGDRYGNPVQPGTAVYFTTDGGIIEGSGVTDELGQAPVVLVSAAPRPSNAYGGCDDATRPEGYAVIRARTSDLDNTPIETTTPVLFSGRTQIGIVQTGLSIMPYDYVVSDQFGHPLAPGTTISVVADGTNIKATGDAAVTLGDHLCPGPGRTEFRIGIAEDDTDIGAETPVLTSITITVTSPNGNASLTRSALGRRAVAADVFERLD